MSILSINPYLTTNRIGFIDQEGKAKKPKRSRKAQGNNNFLQESAPIQEETSKNDPTEVQRRKQKAHKDLEPLTPQEEQFIFMWDVREADYRILKKAVKKLGYVTDPFFNRNLEEQVGILEGFLEQVEGEEKDSVQKIYEKGKQLWKYYNDLLSFINHPNFQNPNSDLVLDLRRKRNNYLREHINISEALIEVFSGKSDQIYLEIINKYILIDHLPLLYGFDLEQMTIFEEERISAVIPYFRQYCASCLPPEQLQEYFEMIQKEDQILEDGKKQAWKNSPIVNEKGYEGIIEREEMLEKRRGEQQNQNVLTYFIDLKAPTIMSELSPIATKACLQNQNPHELQLLLSLISQYIYLKKAEITQGDLDDIGYQMTFMDCTKNIVTYLEEQFHQGLAEPFVDQTIKNSKMNDFYRLLRAVEDLVIAMEGEPSILREEIERLIRFSNPLFLQDQMKALQQIKQEIENNGNFEMVINGFKDKDLNPLTTDDIQKSFNDQNISGVWECLNTYFELLNNTLMNEEKEPILNGFHFALVTSGIPEEILFLLGTVFLNEKIDDKSFVLPKDSDQILAKYKRLEETFYESESELSELERHEIIQKMYCLCYLLSFKLGSKRAQILLNQNGDETQFGRNALISLWHARLTPERTDDHEVQSQIVRLLDNGGNIPVLDILVDHITSHQKYDYELNKSFMEALLDDLRNKNGYGDHQSLFGDAIKIHDQVYIKLSEILADPNFVDSDEQYLKTIRRELLELYIIVRLTMKWVAKNDPNFFSGPHFALFVDLLKTFRDFCVSFALFTEDQLIDFNHGKGPLMEIFTEEDLVKVDEAFKPLIPIKENITLDILVKGQTFQTFGIGSLPKEVFDVIEKLGWKDFLIEREDMLNIFWFPANDEKSEDFKIHGSFVLGIDTENSPIFVSYRQAFEIAKNKESLTIFLAAIVIHEIAHIVSAKTLSNYLEDYSDYKDDSHVILCRFVNEMVSTQIEFEFLKAFLASINENDSVYDPIKEYARELESCLNSAKILLGLENELLSYNPKITNDKFFRGIPIQNILSIPSFLGQIHVKSLPPYNDLMDLKKGFEQFTSDKREIQYLLAESAVVFLGRSVVDLETYQQRSLMAQFIQYAFDQDGQKINSIDGYIERESFINTYSAFMEKHSVAIGNENNPNIPLGFQLLLFLARDLRGELSENKSSEKEKRE